MSGGSRECANKILRVGISRLLDNSLHHTFSLSCTSTSMLTTRGAVARLSKRSFNSVKQTNAFFSSAAAVQRLALPTNTQQRRALPRASPASPSAGQCSFSLSPFLISFSGSDMFFRNSSDLCNRVQTFWYSKNCHWCRCRCPVRLGFPPSYS